MARPRAPARFALLWAGLGMAYLVGHDGSWGWQLARLIVVGTTTWSVHRLLGRLDGARRSSLALLAGMVLLPIGLGIALPYVTKTGLTAMSIAGLLILTGGGALGVTGAIGVLRTLSRWWRVLAAPALLAPIAVVSFVVGPPVAFTNVPPTTVGTETPTDRGMRHEDVDFESADGVALTGWYIPSRSGAAVVLLHGAGSTRSSVLGHAEVLARHGFGVLLYDARGHGNSAGRAMDAGWWGDEDAAGAVTFLEDREEVDPTLIALVGMSMGGEQAIGAGAADPRVRAVVAEGATQRRAADKTWQSEVYGVPGWLQEQLDRASYRLVDLLTSADPPTPLRDAAAAMSPRPVLLITAGSVPDEGHAARHIRSGSPETVQVWTVPGSGHTGGLSTDPDAWESRVVGFLDGALTRTR